MGKKTVKPKLSKKLKTRVEEFLNSNLSAIKKISPRAVRELLEDLQIYQIELDNYSKELQKVSAELQQSEARLRNILSSMDDLVFTLDRHNRFVSVYAPEDKLYLKPEEFIGKKVPEALPAHITKLFNNALPKIKTGHIAEFEYHLEMPAGLEWYHLKLSPIMDDGNFKGSVAVVRDITEKKRIDAQLRQARKMESIGTMAGGIAHDFNNILYMITGNAELAMGNIPEWNPVHDNLKVIKTAALRAAGIVKQLLSFSRKSEQDIKPIGATTVIKDALKFLRSTIPSSIEIRKNLSNRELTILGDPAQINQMMINLCINASQEMEETGGILEITVEGETLAEGSVLNNQAPTPGEYLKITISDTGPGIDSEIIDRIFDPYFTTKDAGQGSGMGLSVVHGIIQNHNGAITVESQPGKGTTFTIHFPVVAAEPMMSVKTSDETPHGNESILFVDDEEFITDMIGKMLKRLGYKVVTKTNPAEAWELFQTKPDQFDLVITDMTMPQMNGVKLSKKLKELRSDIPVIICTGHSSLIDEEKAKELGIDAYVMKPIVKSGIAKIIRNVLDKAKDDVQQ